jgi:hypothetical protein
MLELVSNLFDALGVCICTSLREDLQSREETLFDWRALDETSSRRSFLKPLPKRAAHNFDHITSSTPYSVDLRIYN